MPQIIEVIKNFAVAAEHEESLKETLESLTSSAEEDLGEASRAFSRRSPSSSKRTACSSYGPCWWRCARQMLGAKPYSAG